MGVNVKEFLYQLSSISFRVNCGLSFNVHHRNHFSHNQLFKIFDWSVYSEEQSCVLSVSIKERELNKSTNNGVVMQTPPMMVKQK